jgi:preprotein translocase subunit SecG
MIYNIFLAIHVLVCIVLIVVVLMQSSKGGGLAGAFGGGGGGGDQALFGGHETATFLSKATTYLAVLFMVLSLVLAFLASNRSTGSDSAIRRSLQGQGNIIPTGQGVDDVLSTSVFDTVPADTTNAPQ